jgi:hypothetical protein
VVRAAVEAESHLDQPRFDAFDHAPVPLVATSPAWADLARQLGTVADTCALADPLMPPGRVLEALEAVRAPTAPLGLAGSFEAPASPPIPAARLLRLATMASRKAALSSRQEIYHRGMPALQALKASMGALVGATELKIQELQDRVRGRYPEAEPLPGRPLLDRLLEEAGAPLHWDPAAADGAGAYRRDSLHNGLTAGTTTLFARHPTRDGSAPPAASAAVADAVAMEARLQRSLQQGGLLVLTVEPRLARHAEAALLRRFGPGSGASGAGSPLQRLSIDAVLLRELRRQADALRVDWATVLRADAADPISRDWRNLLSLVRRTLPAVQEALLNSAGPLLVVNAGLLARYELMELATALEAHAGRPGHTPAAWMLLPTHQNSVAAIDGVTVPLVNPGAVAALPVPWVENIHRAMTSPTP